MGISTSFLYDGVNPVQELNGTTVTANLLTGGVDERFLRTDASGTANYLTDALGSTVALTDSTGNSNVQYSYAPYGSISITGTTTNSYTYTGREIDGLAINYYRARYYNPATGRFLSEDPLGFDGGDVNLYAYVEDNPINETDPLGLYHCVGGANCDFTPPMQQALQCFDQCTGNDTAITSGRRPASPRHPNSSHCRGEAADAGRGANPDLTPQDAGSCFRQCFQDGYGQEENNSGSGTHFHLQLHTVPGGHPGFANGVQPYNP